MRGQVPAVGSAGQVIPGRAKVKFIEDAVEGGAGIGRRPPAAVGGGRGNQWLDECPLFVG